MTRKLLVAFISILLTFFVADKLQAKKFRYNVGGKEISIDCSDVNELKSHLQKNYPDYNIKSIDKTGVVDLERTISLKVYDGKDIKSVTVPYGNVRSILKFLDISLNDKDFVLPKEEEFPLDDKIKIFRVKYEIEESVAEKNFETIEQVSKNPADKKEVVLQDGKNGNKKIFTKVKYVNGVKTSSVVIKEEVLVEPVDKIVRIPMKGIEAITRGATRSFVMNATAYEAGPLSTGKRPGQRGYGITASGTRARRGTVAVDRRVIPLGTKLYVKSLDPSVPDYGYAIAEDTGGAIKGMRIDLFMNTVWECFQFGRRKVKVFILPQSTPNNLFRWFRYIDLFCG